jgi:ethanolamine utilization protein EutN
LNLGRVIGTVISSRKVESLDGVKLLIVQPLDENLEDQGEPMVACDSQQTGPGQVVTFIGGREASLPLPDPFNPSDATITSIVDEVSLGNR